MASIGSLDETPKPLNEYHENSGFMLGCAFTLFFALFVSEPSATHLFYDTCVARQHNTNGIFHFSLKF